jgi:hypothetical protein
MRTGSSICAAGKTTNTAKRLEPSALDDSGLRGYFEELTMPDNQYVYWAPAQINAEFTHPASTPNSIGDLLYWDAVALVVKPANLLADLGSLVLMQSAFARLFMGVANSKQLATDATPRNARILIDGVWEFPCVAGSTFVVGDHVGINYLAPALTPQQVVKVNVGNLAIGRVIKAYPTATAKVKIRIMSRYLLGIPDRFSSFGPGSAPIVLADDNSAVTLDQGLLLSCNASSPRSKNLPSEAQSQGTEMNFTNFGSATVTFLSSTGLGIRGNGAVPSGKSAFLWCDGTNWTGLVSA